MKKEYFIGKQTVFYESTDEPRTIICEERDYYVKCKEKDVEKLAKKLHNENTFTLLLMQLTLEQPNYKGWKVKNK